MHTLPTSGPAAPGAAVATSPTVDGSCSQPVPPVIAGKYTILGELGHGAMGRVFKAHDASLDRTVAVKRIAGAGAAESSAAERFRREARLAASLNHPNIVTVYDFGEDAHGFYMVMELLEGTDLGTVLRRRLLAGLEQKLDVVEQILDGVAFAHAQGLIHRDLKPANVHRSPEGRVKILDFGLARSDEPRLTTVGSVLGTPRYMAPEQVKGEAAGARCDVFALGAMTYEILTGERCFPAPSVHAAIFQVLERQPPPLASFDPTLPAAAERVVARAIAKRPADRYQDAGDMRQAVAWLRRLVQGEVSESQVLSAIDAPAGTLAGSRDGGATATASGSGSVSGAAFGGASGSSSPTMTPATPVGPARLTLAGEPGGDRQLLVQEPGEKSLLELSLAAGVPHFHECGGRARCSTCRVRVVSGAGCLTPRNRLEQKLAQRLGWGDDIRLACQTRLAGDAAVKRLIRDTDDFGLLRFENRQSSPQERAVAMLVCEVDNFAELTRRAAPYDAVHILNRFFLQVGEPILACGGEIEGTQGERLVARFAAGGAEGSRPGGGRARDNCLAAVRAALRILARLEDLNRYAQSHFQVALAAGIGLHFGRTIFGRVGHPSDRRLTMIGPAPRLADWLCRASRDSGLPIVASEDLVNVVEDDVAVGEMLSEPGPGGRETAGYQILDFVKADAMVVAQSTFSQVAARKREAAELFYRLLFEIAPDVRPLFAGVDIEVQGEMLMDMLAKVVDGLDRLEELRPAVEALGRRHAGYGVELRHFDAVEQALLETFRQLLGSAFTTDVRLAWSRVYNQLAKIMIEAMESVAPPPTATADTVTRSPG